MELLSPDFNKLASLAESNRQVFETFYSLLTEYNAKYNLTSILEERDVYYKHFLDSIAGEDLFPENARVAEIGSGAGFPSVPLMIVRGDLKFTLIESTGKKCEFLKTVVNELHLNANVLCERAEVTAKKAEYREQFDVCCARAVARLNTLSEYCLPFVKPGGSFIAYKGNAEEEIKESGRAIALLGGKIRGKICYDLPEGYGERTLVVVGKTSSTPEKYPRGQGKERSKPL